MGPGPGQDLKDLEARAQRACAAAPFQGVKAPQNLERLVRRVVANGEDPTALATQEGRQPEEIRTIGPGGQAVQDHEVAREEQLAKSLGVAGGRDDREGALTRKTRRDRAAARLIARAIGPRGPNVVREMDPKCPSQTGSQGEGRRGALPQDHRDCQTGTEKKRNVKKEELPGQRGALEKHERHARDDRSEEDPEQGVRCTQPQILEPPGQRHRGQRHQLQKVALVERDPVKAPKPGDREP